MEIETGLKEYQVLQRNEHNMAVVKCQGTCNLDIGTVEISVTDSQGIPVGSEWKAAGEVCNGTWTVPGLHIPTGGEYTVRFRIANDGEILDETVVRHILVGDLWILAGQSNMQGVGLLRRAEKPIDTVHSFSMDDKWCLAEEPLHKLWESVDRVHSAAGGGYSDRGVCPGLAFAKEIVSRTGVPIGLIPCAHGGTSMEQWSPNLRALGGESLYGAMLRRFYAVGGQVAGVLWYQGESDTSTERDVLAFSDKLCDFVQSIRSDFQNEKLPFFCVQIGRVIVQEINASLWNSIQEAQRLCEEKIPCSRMVASIDLPLDDLIHISGDGQNRLGRRLAKAVCSEVFRHPLATGPKLEMIEVEPTNRTTVRVDFSNVNGGLTSHGRPNGFTVVSQDGERLPIIYDVKIDRYTPSSVILHLTMPLPMGSSIAYGMGLDPYCNIVDKEDMAVPVFGPILCDA